MAFQTSALIAAAVAVAAALTVAGRPGKPAAVAGGPRAVAVVGPHRVAAAAATWARADLASLSVETAAAAATAAAAGVDRLPASPNQLMPLSEQGHAAAPCCQEAA